MIDLVKDGFAERVERKVGRRTWVAYKPGIMGIYVYETSENIEHSVRSLGEFLTFSRREIVGGRKPEKVLEELLEYYYFVLDVIWVNMLAAVIISKHLRRYNEYFSFEVLSKIQEISKAVEAFEKWISTHLMKTKNEKEIWNFTRRAMRFRHDPIHKVESEERHMIQKYSYKIPSKIAVERFSEQLRKAILSMS